jgi:hypothetical protein
MQKAKFNQDDDPEYNFTAEDIKVFDERRKKRLSGESKTYSWHEAKKIITQQHPPASR